MNEYERILISNFATTGKCCDAGDLILITKLCTPNIAKCALSAFRQTLDSVKFEHFSDYAKESLKYIDLATMDKPNSIEHMIYDYCAQYFKMRMMEQTILEDINNTNI